MAHTASMVLDHTEKQKRKSENADRAKIYCPVIYNCNFKNLYCPVNSIKSEFKLM